ncbi:MULTISPECIES: sialate O-acetylesterase [unclassified Pseudoxanthomonas]|uniref:sialate O-acetylesterase n=1 Tax=unclassified Pseudoxanthomonas TaxID=2645906 RepID=UPI00307785E1
MKPLLAWLGALVLFSPCAQAKVELPLLFSDGAVVQRDKPLPVWGWASPGANIEVEFDGRSATATAAKDGAWRVELPAHKAGGPYTLRVRGDGEPVAVRDVLVGDVWLASGQSNMEWPLHQAKDAQQAIASANDPLIRHFKVPKSWSEKPETRLVGGSWKAASPQTVGEFSAVGYHFARELRANTGVPIGIINSTWGGSRVEAWMDGQTLGIETTRLAKRMRDLRVKEDRDMAIVEGKLAQWGALPADDTGWQVADLDDSAWVDIAVPVLWEEAGWLGLDGVGWYRTSFQLTAEQARNGVRVSFGRVDDSDQAWVNGVAVGGITREYNTPRQYDVPAKALRAGRNVLAVKVIDDGGGGGIHGSAEELHVQLADGTRLPLAREWKFRVAQARLDASDGKNLIETLLYNQMILPAQPYALRGVIWYQGEANADKLADAYRYREQFPALIGQWRRQWNAPQLPFLWVQLANFDSGVDVSTEGRTESPWAMLRESQSRTLALLATAQVVTIDVGDAKDIHPLDKKTVGHRLALAARHVVYGETLVYSGPVYRSVSLEAGRARVVFDLGDSALAIRGSGNELHGFEIAGADRKFHPARAVIDGDTVVVSSDAVAKPQAVRYAWRDNPEDANLINRDGLPASPFRTDAW